MGTPRKKHAGSGQIWRCVEGFAVSQSDLLEKKERRIFVETGELVEFRFWSPACFRTKDNLYLRCEEDEFYERFVFVGDIFGDVSFRNQNSTKEILDARLYAEESP